MLKEDLGGERAAIGQPVVWLVDAQAGLET